MRVQVYDRESHTWAGTWPEAWYKNLWDWAWSQSNNPLYAIELIETELKKYGGTLTDDKNWVDFDDERCYTLVLMRWA